MHLRNSVTWSQQTLVFNMYFQLSYWMIKYVLYRTITNVFVDEGLETKILRSNLNNIYLGFFKSLCKHTFFKSPLIKSPVSDGSIEPSLSSSNCRWRALMLSNPSLSSVEWYKCAYSCSLRCLSITGWSIICWGRLGGRTLRYYKNVMISYHVLLEVFGQTKY